MIIKKELLFGEIAVSERYISFEQLKESLERQYTISKGKSIGKILFDLGYLTAGQINKILSIQEENIRFASGYSPKKKNTDTFFGTLAIAKKYITLERILECLKEQELLERKNLYFRLGEILVSKGYMRVEQVKEILDMQKSKKTICIICGDVFDANDQMEGEMVCVKCSEKRFHNTESGSPKGTKKKG